MIIDPQGELKVKFKNEKIANIYELSSGEKQIVTMLGHLIYFAEKFKTESGIFIIDEPEVSLHLAWQEIFVDSILSASPNTQFILATHSPAITGLSYKNWQGSVSHTFVVTRLQNHDYCSLPR